MFPIVQPAFLPQWSPYLWTTRLVRYLYPLLKVLMYLYLFSVISQRDYLMTTRHFHQIVYTGLRDAYSAHFGSTSMSTCHLVIPIYT